MESKDQLIQLEEIRSMMERSSRFISLSGLAGVSAGLFATIGGLMAYYRFTGSLAIDNYVGRISSGNAIDLLFFILLDAIIVLILSVTSAVYFTTRKARKQGLPVWDKTTFRVIVSLAIPLVAGGVFCLILLYHSLSSPTVNFTLFGLVAPVTLLFYGLALLNASKFTLDEIKWLGISEIILGLFGCIFIGYGLLLWIFGFGILHILYGGLMWWKYEKE